MVHLFLLDLLKNRSFLDLFLILFFYIINYIVTFKFQITICGTNVIFNKIIFYSIITALFTLITRMLLSPFHLPFVLSIFIILILILGLKPKKANIYTWILKSVWSWVLINLLNALLTFSVIRPLILIIPQNFIYSTFGVICGTFVECLIPLLWLIVFRKQGDDFGQNK
jgi:hypothetical protein